MKSYQALMFVLCVVAMAFGCTSKRGLVELHTQPEGATVYLGEEKLGETPLKFEYQCCVPETLKIVSGEQSVTEVLGKGWLKNEHIKGNYSEERYHIEGKKQKAWKVKTTRKLQ